MQDSDPRAVEPVRGDGPELLQKLSRWAASAATFWQPEFDRMREDCEYAHGEVEGDVDGKPGVVRVNVVHSTIQGLMPHVYARNPEVAFTPAEGVDQSMLPAVKAFAGVMQTAIQRSFRKAGLKALMKAGTRTALTRSLVWFKVTFQREYRQDPIVRQRIADAQDNLASLDRLIAQAGGGAGAQEGVDHEAARAELGSTLESLEQQAEVLLREGLAIDRVQPNHLILDPAIPDLTAWQQSRRIDEIVWMARDEAEERFGRMFDQALTWTWKQVRQAEKAKGERTADSDRYGSKDAMVKCHELWDHGTLQVYTWLQGDSDYARDPYTPTKQGQQWYPYHPLAFHPTDGYVIPLNLVRLLSGLQDEYIRTRTQQDEHREVSIPTWVASADTDESTLRRHKDAVLGEVVLVDAKGQPIDNVIKQQPAPAYNPALYDVSQIRVDIETMSGLSDAQRGAIARAKTLGEAEIMQAGVQGRSDELRDTVEDTIEAIAAYGAEVLVLELNPMQAARLAGPAALMSWPAADKRELFDQVNVEVRAGSAGRPNKTQEQRTWAEILPVIERLQDTIITMAAQGLDPSPKVELLRQTLRRFDESLELDALLPQEIVAFIRQREAMRGFMQDAPGMLGGPGEAGADVIPFPPSSARPA